MVGGTGVEEGGTDVGGTTVCGVEVGVAGSTVIEGLTPVPVGVAVYVAEATTVDVNIAVGWLGGLLGVAEAYTGPGAEVCRTTLVAVGDKNIWGVTVGTAVSRLEITVEIRSGKSVD